MQACGRLGAGMREQDVDRDIGTGIGLDRGVMGPVVGGVGGWAAGWAWVLGPGCGAVWVCRPATKDMLRRARSARISGGMSWPAAKTVNVSVQSWNSLDRKSTRLNSSHIP